MKRILPWGASILIHGLLIGAGFLITWSVVRETEEEPPLLIVADFNAFMFDPEPVSSDLETEAEKTGEKRATEDIFEDMPEEAEEDNFLEGVDLGEVLPEAVQDSPTELFPALPPVELGAAFVGVETTNARRIVYVIDASGSMVRSLRVVKEELTRSLSGLSDEQQFGILFFQGNEAIMTPPEHRLTAGTPRAIARMLRWIDEHVLPRGRSNPMAALERALRLKPDVIFLLSENITGSGEYEIGRDELLRWLNERNPIDPRNGRRRTVINCIQFMDPDPQETLRMIAEIHGGPGGYRFLGREELGLGTR